MDEQVLHIEGRLAVREKEAAFLVVREEDPDDWLARFGGLRTWPTSTTDASLASDTSLHASCQLPSRAVGHAAIHSSRERKSERTREGPL
jgi:hypothetical protein